MLGLALLEKLAQAWFSTPDTHTTDTPTLRKRITGPCSVACGADDEKLMLMHMVGHDQWTRSVQRTKAKRQLMSNLQRKQNERLSRVPAKKPMYGSRTMETVSRVPGTVLHGYMRWEMMLSLHGQALVSGVQPECIPQV